jgi:hypothetical protein
MLGLLYIPFITQRQIIGHNSLHNTLAAYVYDFIRPIKMYNVTIKILKLLKLLLHVSAVQGHHQVRYKWGFLFHCTRQETQHTIHTRAHQIYVKKMAALREKI